MNRQCGICGCTDRQAREGGCFWFDENVCSRCAPQYVASLAINAAHAAAHVLGHAVMTGELDEIPMQSALVAANAAIDAFELAEEHQLVPPLRDVCVMLKSLGGEEPPHPPLTETLPRLWLPGDPL